MSVALAHGVVVCNCGVTYSVDEVHSCGPMREFATGATRHTAEGKPDYVGYTSPLVEHAFGEYMLKHQTQADGQRRASDNWKKGIPLDAYYRSLGRHWHDVRLFMEGFEGRETLIEALCAMRFNLDGMMYELLRSTTAPAASSQPSTGSPTTVAASPSLSTLEHG